MKCNICNEAQATRGDMCEACWLSMEAIDDDSELNEDEE